MIHLEDFSFVSIDVEGGNWELLQALIEFRGMPKLRAICVEADDKRSEMRSLLNSRGFYEIYSSQENLVMGRDLP
jgi:hypothetical protein